MKHILNSIIAIVFLTSQISFGAMNLPPSAQERQYLKKEWLKDPSFELGNGATPSEAGTVTYQTAWGSNTLSGRSISWNPSVAGTLTFLNFKQSNGTEFTVKANSSGSLRGSCLVNGNDSTHTYTIEIYDVTNAAVVKAENVIIGDSASWNFQKVQSIVTPTSDTLYRLRLQATANEANIYIDDCNFGFEEGIQAVNVNQVFSAVISSAGVVSGENTDWISGNCTNASPSVCTFVSGFFTSAPNCTGSNNEGLARWISFSSVSATSLSMKAWNDAGTDETTSRTKVVLCQKSEPNSGFAVRMDQTNYGPTAYTPTFAGMGTVTAIDMWHSRDGAYLVLEGNYTTGTASGTTLSMTLPQGLAIASSYGSITVVGRSVAARSATGTEKDQSVLATAAGTVVQFSAVSDGGFDPLAAQTGSSILYSSTKFSISARVRIQGWTENQNAPLIIGGVTSSYSGTMRTEVASITNAGVVTEVSGNWINGNGSVASTSEYTLTLTSGVFSSAPICVANVVGTVSGADRGAQIISTSATTVVYYTAGNSASTAYPVHIQCTGPR